MRLETILVQDRSERADGLGASLIADLVDATCAYARLSQTTAPDFVRDAAHTDGALIVLDAEQILAQDLPAPDASARAPKAGTLPPDASGEDSPAKELPIARASRKDRPCAWTAASAGSVPQSEREHAPERARITYFIVCSNRQDASTDELDTCAEKLKNACAARGNTWGGMLYIGSAADLARRFGTTRMGIWRRRTSEATDRLIAAIRVGASVEECQLHAGAASPIDPASIIDVRRPFPRWIPRAILGLKRR